nr:MAG TPA: Putative head tail adaptor [Caudoviricetes sp.]
MDIGTLDRRVTFIALMDAVGHHGATTKVESDVFTCWARVEPARGRERMEAFKVSQEDTYKITIRFRHGISSDMKIRYQQYIFEIQSIVDPYMSHALLEIYCRRLDRGKKVVT